VVNAQAKASAGQQAFDFDQRTLSAVRSVKTTQQAVSILEFPPYVAKIEHVVPAPAPA
jgi:hypothetical protein